MLLAPLVALANEEKLAEAEKLYLTGEWEKARQAYNEILAAGPAENLTSAFYYNLGTASARAGSTGVGYAYLLKALSQKPLDSDITQNLKLTESKLSPATRAIRPSTWLSSWPVPLHFLPEGIWLVPILVCAAGLLWSAGSGESRARIIGWASALALCFAVGFTGYQQSNSPVAAFVKAGQVKSGPNATFSNIIALEPGALVNAEEERDGWLKIRFVAGDQQELVGWIEAGALMSLR